MLDSRHIFIQKGSLSFNDNGSKKFNTSRIRYRDEMILEETDEKNDLLLDCFDPEVEEILEKNISDKIDRVNYVLNDIKDDEKVLIYGGGELTQFFLRHTKITDLNIIGVVDRNRNPVFNIKVKDTTYDNIALADVIIIIPYYAATEIKNYLQSLNLHGRIICLSDVCGGIILNGYENIWAPDAEAKIDGGDYKKRNRNLFQATTKVNMYSPYFVSVKKYMEYKTRITGINGNRELEKKTALIIQGPMVYKQDFTYNSVQLYRRNFPDMHIILSVWDDEKILDRYPDIECENISIVYSTRPQTRGYQNINLQLTTTYAGLLKAGELGCEFAFKTRTDMRFYSPYMLDLVYWFIESFPVKDTSCQKNRLVIFPPRYDYFFFISDFFMFGSVEDMIQYWNIDPAFSNEYVGESAETMLGIRYAKYIDHFVSNDLDNLSEYQNVIFNYFAVLEDKLLDYVWYKYFYNKLWEQEYHYNVLNFSDWLAGQNCKVKTRQYSDELNDKEKKHGAKRVLFYVTDARMATKYLESIDRSNIHLKLVRKTGKTGNIFLYSKFLFVSGEIIPVDIVQENDYEWADQILFLSRDSLSAAEIESVEQKWKEKVQIIENPYITVRETYKNKSGESFEIWDSFSEIDDSTYEIDGTDIPFIFESKLGAINKSQTKEYYTYSIGRKNLDAGIYFDEDVIAKQKKYQMFNSDVKVIVYGNKKNRQFVNETLLLYKSIYGESSVYYVQFELTKDSVWKQLEYICASDDYENNKKYILIPDNIRIISPFLIELFESLKERFGCERLGVVNPEYKKINTQRLIIYGTRKQILDFVKNVRNDDWYSAIMNNFIVLDYEMLNLIDLERRMFSLEDKKNKICFLEWLRYQLNI